MAKAKAARDPIFIGVAWPYANGPLHLGHIAGSLLPPDIFRRFMRMQGHPVLMVSGSDCHGTPILLKAEKEGKRPEEVVDHFHRDHVVALERLGIGFDLFTRTTTKNHEAVVQRIFLDALEGGYIEKRTAKAPYDATAKRFLPDRYVEGICPHCDYEEARGDQCDKCGKTLDPQDLRSPRSKLHPDQAITFRDTDHYFFLLGKLQDALARYVERTAGHWRPNTVNFTQNWLREGLQDRAITRDLTWGIKIPLEGVEDKRIYVWFEAVCGYLSAAMEWAQRSCAGGFADLPRGAHHDGAPPAADPQGWRRWWCDEKTRSYSFLGKDNIPFHTIIWPAILIAHNEARGKRNEPLLVLPYDVPANEFLNLDGKQFSKSRGISIGVHDVLDRFDADAVRYYLSVNMPEGRDADWTWDDFHAKVNDELVGIIGNLAHRILSFVHSNLGKIPEAPPEDDPFDKRVRDGIAACADEVALHMGVVQLRKGMRRILEFAVQGNQWMQEAAPWRLIKDDPPTAKHRLATLLRVPKALAILLAPYLPAAAQRLWHDLGEEGSVHEQTYAALHQAPRAGATLPAPTALFRKLTPDDIPARPQEPTMPTVTIDQFQAFDIRVARVEGVEVHPKADKLYVLRLDVGALGERQVVAGLREHMAPEELLHRHVAFIANLQPAKLRGVESQGMILAADDGQGVAFLTPSKDVAVGAKVR